MLNTGTIRTPNSVADVAANDGTYYITNMQNSSKFMTFEAAQQKTTTKEGLRPGRCGGKGRGGISGKTR